MQRTTQSHATQPKRVDHAQLWAARLPGLASSGVSQTVIALIGRLRLVPGVRVLVKGNDLWLRGEDLDDRVSLILRSLPDAERFLVTTDGQLTAWDESVPRATLPEADWHSLAQWLSVELPTSVFAGRVAQRVSMRLVRSNAVATANLLRTQWPIWRDYAITAPQIRLNPLSFAVSDSGEVLIRGLPLPPIPGRSLVEQSGIAISAGWSPDPPLDPASIRLVLKLNPDEIAVFQDDATMDVILESVFVRATRSAVRLTDASLSGSPIDG